MVAPAAHVVDVPAVRVLAVGVVLRAAAECAAVRVLAVLVALVAPVVVAARAVLVAVTADVAVATVVAARRCRSARGAISSRT